VLNTLLSFPKWKSAVQSHTHTTSLYNSWVHNQTKFQILAATITFNIINSWRRKRTQRKQKDFHSFIFHFSYLFRSCIFMYFTFTRSYSIQALTAFIFILSLHLHALTAYKLSQLLFSALCLSLQHKTNIP